MTVKRNSKDELVITLSGKVDPVDVERTLKYFRYLEATAGSKAVQADVDKLADEVKRKWWRKNKKSFLS